MPDVEIDNATSPGAVLAWATAGVLLGSLILQFAFYSDHGHNALGDVPGRFIVDRVRPGALPYLEANVEYPVIIGLAMWVASLAFANALGFTLATFAMSAGCAAALVAQLWRRCGPRAWLLVTAPASFLYTFHNWDMAPVLFGIAGVLAFEARKDVQSGVLLGLGASTKLFPGLFLPVLAVVRLSQGDRNGAARLVGSGVAVTALFNLPFLIASPSGWAYPARFQGARRASWGSLWYYFVRAPGIRPLLAGHTVRFVNVASIAALACALIGIAIVAWRGTTPPAALCAATVVAFLLTNKIYSPNYDLWLVAFFPLVAWPRNLRWGFNACSVAMWLAVFGHFQRFVPDEVTTATLRPIVFVRAAVLVALGITALRLVDRSTRSPVAASPASRSDSSGS